MNREIELKLELDARLYDEILATCPEVQTEVRQENTFFDTNDRVLGNNRWALRIRREGDIYMLTVKGPSHTTPDGIFERIELESPIIPEEAERFRLGLDLEQTEIFPCTHLRELFGNLHLVPFLSFRNLRRFISVHSMDLELDKTEIEGKIFYELEVETTPERSSTDSASLRKWFADKNWRYTPSKMSKLQRAMGSQNP
jgi:inorganic triphosphatase YgiF